MEVSFRSSQLERCYRNSQLARRRWGDVVARKYIQRVKQLLNVMTVQDLRQLRFMRLHALSGRRAGQFAIDLTGRWRLIVVIHETSGSLEIMEVTNHYDD